MGRRQNGKIHKRKAAHKNVPLYCCSSVSAGRRYSSIICSFGFFLAEPFGGSQSAGPNLLSSPFCIPCATASLRAYVVIQAGKRNCENPLRTSVLRNCRVMNVQRLKR